MKRLLLALLLLAAPASADVLVVHHPYPLSITSAKQIALDNQYATLEAILDTYVGREHWAAVDSRGTKTLWCNTGTQVYGATTRQFDVVVHFGFTLTNGGTVPFSGSPVRVDSLLRTGTGSPWFGGNNYGTSVPQILIGTPMADAFQWDQQAACSTGTSGYSSGYNTALGYHSLYMVGQPYVWKMHATGASGMFAPKTAYGTNGIWRTIVSYGATGITSAALANCSALPCDNVTRSAAPDSALLWAHYRSASDVAPRIFVQPGGAGTTELVAIGLIKKALALGDSITGGRVFQEPKLLARKHGLWIRRAFSRGTVTNQTSMDVGGLTNSRWLNGGTPVNCGSAECDSMNMKAGIDSLAALKIKFTVGVEIDSVDTYPSEKAWWARAPLARYGLETYAGSITGRGSAASATHPMDPFGRLRSRVMIAGVLPMTCGSADSSSHCLLKALRSLMETRFPGKVDRAIFPSFSDHTPPAATVNNVSAYIDSVAEAAQQADWKAILIEPSQPNGNAGRTYSSNTGVNTTAPSAPLGGSPNTRRVKTLSGRPFKFLGVRWEPQGTDTFSIGGHSVGSEWGHGDLRGNWYPDRAAVAGLGLSIFYHHDFATRTPVLAFNAASLSATGANPARVAYWQVKWITNDWRSTDALMIPGKQLDVWDYVENLDPRP